MILVAGRPRSGTTWLSETLSCLLGHEFLFEPFAGIQPQEEYCWGDHKYGGISKEAIENIWGDEEMPYEDYTAVRW